MTTTALLVALALAGQARSANERYPADGNTGQATTPTNGSPGESGLIPKFTPPPASTRPRTSAPSESSGRGTNGVSPPPGVSDGETSPYRSLQVQARAANPTTPATPRTNVIKPSTMMKQMMSPPLGSDLSGSSISLMDVVAGARARHDQAHRIEAYWDLCSSAADYYLGVREQDELRRLRTMMPQAGATLQQAEAEFDVRLATSKLAAVASQRRLASMIGSSNASLPLPADLPHCGSYKSLYDQIFADRPSVEAQELAALLSSRYAELKAAATGVTRTQEWIDTVARNESGDGTDTLRALELLALRRRAFVQIARDYNRRIARYTELSTPGDIGAERLVGMLIKVSVPPTATRPTVPSGTNGRQSRDTRAAQRTFAKNDGWESASQSVSRATTRDDSVKPASAEVQKGPRQERSLLVSPQ